MTTRQRMNGRVKKLNQKRVNCKKNGHGGARTRWYGHEGGEGYGME